VNWEALEGGNGNGHTKPRNGERNGNGGATLFD